MCNNIRIESELDGVFEKTGYDVEERNPFSVYGLGAVQGPKKDTYQCRQHKKIDCEKCFDWVKIIKMDAGYPIGDDSSYLDTLD
ncbi:hypothetical protein H0H93_000968 [Arthromyces matolae]|nr:hypothetical protein H0H93_000968 [Arthromyces matolae]